MSSVSTPVAVTSIYLICFVKIVILAQMTIFSGGDPTLNKEMPIDANDEIQIARENLAAAYRLVDKFEFNEGIGNHFTMAMLCTERSLSPDPLWTSLVGSNRKYIDGS